ncbi:MAG: rRNA pseudouridine synthase, partial [Eubacteriales bacterium]|nr:rRNA pseudouridine synthase [Eubacteriales bacterium]
KYIAKVLGIPSNEKLEKFKKGLIIDNYKTAPASIKIIKSEHNISVLEIIISEGKNRQIRKMCQAIGHNVIELKRIAIENLTIGNLKKGEFRYLNNKEINYLKKISKI